MSNVIQFSTAAGGERRSRRAGVTPRAWSGREIVRVQPARTCRRCRAVRLCAWRITAFAVVIALAVVTYAPIVGFVVHLIGRGR